MDRRLPRSGTRRPARRRQCLSCPKSRSFGAGLDAHVVGRSITAVRVHHPRAVRRHEAGPADLTARLLGSSITGTGRRGKFLWLMLDGTEALVVHLGMSGQMLLGEVARTEHLRIATLLDDGTALSFVDQRTFGGWMLADLVSVDGSEVPEPVAHIARDPLDPLFDRDAVVKVLRRKHSEIKRQLLDQTVVSGIGNIYADESLWRAKVNGARLADTLSQAEAGHDPRPCHRRHARRARARAARRSTRCTSTSTASPATSTARWTRTAARVNRAVGAAR